MQFLEDAYTGSDYTAVFNVRAPDSWREVLISLLDIAGDSDGEYVLQTLTPDERNWVAYPLAASNKLSIDGTPAMKVDLTDGFYCLSPSSAESGTVAIGVSGIDVVLNVASPIL
jgi:hypothetical protein